MTERQSSSSLKRVVDSGLCSMGSFRLQTTSFYRMVRTFGSTTVTACTAVPTGNGYPLRARVPTGDSQEFLLAVPPPTKNNYPGRTEKKDRRGYRRACRRRWFRKVPGVCPGEIPAHPQPGATGRKRGGTPTAFGISNYTLVSGLPADTVLDQGERGGGYPDIKVVYWLDGRDSALFDIVDGPSTGIDDDGDGDYDSIRYDRMVQLARPLPAGEYKFDMKEPLPRFWICNFVVSNEWTVTVVAPEGVVHEGRSLIPSLTARPWRLTAPSACWTPQRSIESGAATDIDHIEWEGRHGQAEVQLPHRPRGSGGGFH